MEDLKQIAKFNVEGCLTTEELHDYKTQVGVLKSIEDSRAYLQSLPKNCPKYIPTSIFNWHRKRVFNSINKHMSEWEVVGTSKAKLVGKVVSASEYGTNGRDYGDVLINVVWSNGAISGMKFGRFVELIMTREFTCNKDCFHYVRRFWNPQYWLNKKLDEKKAETEAKLKPYLDKFEKEKKAHKLSTPMSKHKDRPKSLAKNITRVEAAKRIKAGADSLTPEEKTVMLNWFKENISAIRVYAEEGGTSAQVLEKWYPSEMYGSPKTHPETLTSSDTITTHISLKTLDNMPSDIIYKVSNKANIKDITYKDSKRINNIWLALYLLDELKLKMNVRY